MIITLNANHMNKQLWTPFMLFLFLFVHLLINLFIYLFRSWVKNVQLERIIQKTWFAISWDNKKTYLIFFEVWTLHLFSCNHYLSMCFILCNNWAKMITANNLRLYDIDNLKKIMKIGNNLSCNSFVEEV